MAVYTEVGFDEARALLARLDAGHLQSLQGIASGIENTNYFAYTDQGDWVLTLFERLSAAELPFYLGLMQHLAHHGLPVPAPRADAAGAILHHLQGKPAALVNRLPGAPVLVPGLSHCRALGACLAQMHRAVADFPLAQPNLRGLAWWTATAPLVAPRLTPPQAALLQQELAFQQALGVSAAYAALPTGAVHADLFRDNVMFDGPAGDERLSGVFDFYFAGTDTLLFDLAVCLNDWCVGPESARLDESLAAGLVDAYQQLRTLTPNEVRLLPALRRAGALRFWLSRLADWHLPRAAAVLTPKDPDHFERVLRACIATPWHPALPAAQ
jgi:homoserine kinase type II